MANDILKFKTQLIEDKENREYNKKLREKGNYEHWIGRKETHTFHLCSWTDYGMMVIRNSYTPLIQLDEEDVKYLHNKYVVKLDEEMNEKINKIKKEYAKLS